MELLAGEEGVSLLFATAASYSCSEHRFLVTLTGHVGAVYMVCWSPDSRFLASASKDSTVKVWHAGTASRGKAKYTLAGHEDEVG